MIDRGPRKESYSKEKINIVENVYMCGTGGRRPEMSEDGIGGGPEIPYGDPRSKADTPGALYLCHWLSESDASGCHLKARHILCCQSSSQIQLTS
jgi:hypothetical protein